MRSPKLSLTKAGEPAERPLAPGQDLSSESLLHPSFRNQGMGGESVPTRPNFWRKSFRELVCDQFGLPDEAFARAVFFRCLKPGRGLLVRVLYFLCPSQFEIEMIALAVVGKASTESQFQDGIREYQRLCRVYRNSLRIRLELRMSCRELNILKDSLLGKSARRRLGKTNGDAIGKA